KRYSRGVYALRDLSITIDKGEFIFLTGPSGAGKSTFLRLLLREDLPSEGELKVAGRDLQTLRPAQIQTYRRTVGFVFQDFRLISRLNVFQNVSFVMRVLGVAESVQQRKTFQVLKWVGLQHRMNAYPEELSGGGQQSALLSTGTIALALLVLGGFLIATANLERLGAEWGSAAEMSVYLEDQVTDGQRRAIEGALAPSEIVASREYVSKETALSRFRATFSDLAGSIETLGTNPLPASFEVRLKAGPASEAGVDALGAKLRGTPGVADVRYDRQWL